MKVSDWNNMWAMLKKVVHTRKSTNLSELQLRQEEPFKVYQKLVKAVKSP